jgi:hypothetical protein
MNKFKKDLTMADYHAISQNYGIHLGAVKGVLDEATKEREATAMLAMDSQQSLITAPNAGIPFFLANYFDPDFIEVLLSPTKMAVIFGEVKKGDWTTRTGIFPIVERTGEVTTYGDWNNNGSAGFNANFPERQSYLYQIITQWGELELDMSALAKINAAAEKKVAAGIVMNRFQDKVYAFGIQGLKCYGLLNDPSLAPSVTPGYKAFNAGAGPWITNGEVTATPNEVFKDVQKLVLQLIVQSGGLIDAESKMTLAMSPESAIAMTATNEIFATNAQALLKINFPNLRFETSIRYKTDAGNLMQLITDRVEGQDTGYCAFSEKGRNHPIIRDLSGFKQKMTAGIWGAIVRQPFAIASMIGL